MDKRLCALVLLVIGMSDAQAGRPERLSRESYENPEKTVTQKAKPEQTVIKVAKDDAKKEKKKAVKPKKAYVKAPKEKTKKAEKKPDHKMLVKAKRAQIDQVTARARIPEQEEKVKVYQEKLDEMRQQIKDKEKQVSQVRKVASSQKKSKASVDKKAVYAERLAAREVLGVSEESKQAAQDLIRKAQVMTGELNEKVEAVEKELKALKAEHVALADGKKAASRELDELCQKAGVKCNNDRTHPIVAAHDRMIQEAHVQKKSATTIAEKKELAAKIDAHKKARAEHIKNEKESEKAAKAERVARKKADADKKAADKLDKKNAKKAKSQKEKAEKAEKVAKASKKVRVKKIKEVKAKEMVTSESAARTPKKKRAGRF